MNIDPRFSTPPPLPKTGRWVPVWVPDDPPTVAEMLAQLTSGKPVLCRPGARGRLTGALKAAGVPTHARTQESGEILFTRCAQRGFKP